MKYNVLNVNLNVFFKFFTKYYAKGSEKHFAQVAILLIYKDLNIKKNVRQSI